jgi:hypothetical protein
VLRAWSKQGARPMELHLSGKIAVVTGADFVIDGGMVTTL